jgi:hypothetical protein
MAYLQAVAKKNKVSSLNLSRSNVLRREKKQIIVIASIHQPSATTFNLFDMVHLLSKGQTCYGGSLATISSYFKTINYVIPEHVNIPEFLLDLVNTDFSTYRGSSAQRLARITNEWRLHSRHFRDQTPAPVQRYGPISDLKDSDGFISNLKVPFILLHRNFIKSYRDVVVYGIRIAMYLGMNSMLFLFGSLLTSQGWQS